MLHVPYVLFHKLIIFFEFSFYYVKISLEFLAQLFEVLPYIRS